MISKITSKILRKKIILIVVLLIVIAVGAFVIFTSDEQKATYVKYTDFNQALENNEIKSVTIESASNSEKIEFIKHKDNTIYCTDNPQYDGFRERLLLAGVDVKSRSSAEEVLIFILDILYYTIFFGMIIFLIDRAVHSYNRAFKVVKHTGISFGDIAGMDMLKKEMMFAVDILKRPEEYRKRGIRPTKGIILEGPPGNGKTLFAKALANEAGVNFIATKGADFQSAFMSLGAKKLKMLFDKAGRHKPCIIFIDEFDGIGERRNYDGTGIDKENNRIITTMLNEMDGFADKDGVLVIAATNSYSSLDEALIRPGRFDLKYNIPNPDRETRIELIRLYTKDKKLGEDIRPEKLADAFSGMSCSSIETILNEASVAALADGKPRIDTECMIKACTKMGIRVKNFTNMFVLERNG